MRLLLANPNTTEAVTALVGAAARRVARPGTEIIPATARFGARIIGTRAEMAIAEHAALDLLARHAAECDAAIVAASTDSGVAAARELFGVPVVGLTQAALHVACLLGGRFATVTLSRRSDATLADMIAAYGLAGRCAGRLVVDATPADLLADRAGVAARIAAAAARLADDGATDVGATDVGARDVGAADCVVLIGAVMADLPPLIQPGVGVPVIEGVACAVGLAELLAGLALPRAALGRYGSMPPRETEGLSEALAARLRQGGTA